MWKICSSIRTELPWHQLASDEKILDKLWLTSAKWTETGIHLERLQQDLKKPRAQETGATKELRTRTGWFSWLWWRGVLNSFSSIEFVREVSRCIKMMNWSRQLNTMWFEDSWSSFMFFLIGVWSDYYNMLLLRCRIYE